jgi:hypothetical protein
LEKGYRKKNLNKTALITNLLDAENHDMGQRPGATEDQIAKYIKAYFDVDFSLLDDKKKQDIMKIINNAGLTDPNRKNYQVGKVLGLSNSQLNMLRDKNRRNPELNTIIQKEVEEKYPKLR